VPPLPWREALAVTGLFFVLHLLLAASNFHLLDPEELEFSNLAIAWLDGALDDPLSFRARMPKEGALLLIAPLIAPFLAVLGPHMWAVRLFNVVFASVCMGAWYLVTRTAAPKLPRWLAMALMVLPLPLMQRTATNVGCVGTHLGTSTWVALALVLCLAAARSAGGRRIALILSAGFFAGVATFWAYSFLPLAPGVVWFVWKVLGPRAVALGGAVVSPFALAQLPWARPLEVIASDDPIGTLTALPLGTQERLGGMIEGPLHNLWVLLVYGPGYCIPATGEWEYLPIGPLWTLPFIALAWRARRRAKQAGPAHDGAVRALRQALWISLAGYGAALVFTGFRIDWYFSGGLRYLYPITSMVVVALATVIPTERPWSARVGGWFLALHVLGFALSMRLDVFPAPWHLFQAYEAATPFQRFDGELDVERIPPVRLPRYALWAGSRYAPDVGVDGDVHAWSSWEGVELATQLDGVARDEFWRGVGMAMALNGDCQAQGTCGLDGAPTDVERRVWEGIAMASCCDTHDALKELAGEHADAIWYGQGRKELMCGRDDSATGSAVIAYEDGVIDAWRRDNWSGVGEVDALTYFREITPMTIYGPEEPLPWFREVRGMEGNPTHCRSGEGEVILRPQEEEGEDEDGE